MGVSFEETFVAGLTLVLTFSTRLTSCSRSSLEMAFSSTMCRYLHLCLNVQLPSLANWGHVLCIFRSGAYVPWMNWSSSWTGKE